MKNLGAALDKPLGPLFRTVAEGYKAQAVEMVEACEHDLRLLLEGKPRSGVFKPESDPVTLLREAAEQLRQCDLVLQLDDEAQARAKKQALKPRDRQFIDWLEETLIPDLKESGTVETAKDFERSIRIIRDLEARARPATRPTTKKRSKA
jgi:hypothetical protein